MYSVTHFDKDSESVDCGEDEPWLGGIDMLPSDASVELEEQYLDFEDGFLTELCESALVNLETDDFMDDEGKYEDIPQADNEENVQEVWRQIGETAESG